MGVKVFTNRKLLHGMWVILMMSLVIPTLAQVPTGTILGVLKDSSGAVVPGAMITITNTDTGLVRTVPTGDDGAYRAPSLPTGHYSVKAEHMGFKSETQQGLTLNLADNAVINFTLQVGTSAQEVVVTSEAPLVNTSNSTLGGLVNEQQMAELPLNGRSYIDLSLLQPGVTQDRNGGGGVQAGTAYSANGAGVRSNYFTLDGAPVGTMFGRSTTSQSGNAMGVDGIKEYKVITSNFEAEYGMTMGSQMAMVSKNGTNQLHGTAFEFLRNSSLDARNYFDTPADSGTKRLPEFRRNNFGASAGGPIRRDKTFVFGVYEGLRQKQGVTALEEVPSLGCHGPGGHTVGNTVIYGPNSSGTIPTSNFPGDPIANGTAYLPCTVMSTNEQVVVNPVMTNLLDTIYNLPNSGTTGYSYPTANLVTENYGQIRVDQNFSAADSGFARYTIQNGYQDAASTSASSTAGPQYLSVSLTRNQFLSLVENHVFSTSIVNTARLSYSRTAYNQADQYAENLISPTLSFVTGYPTGRIQINGGPSNWFPGQNFPQFGNQNIYTLSDDVNYAKGKHSFKFGAVANRYLTGIQQTRSINGIMRYTGTDAFLEGEPYQLELATPGAIDQNRYFSWYALGFYGQDDWRASSRLTLNLGLRYEFVTQLNELNGRQSAFQSELTSAAPTIGPTMRDRTHLDFSPRIGFAYDLLGDGKTSVRGGFGIYYDHSNIGTALEQTTLASEPFSSDTVITGTTGNLGVLASSGGKLTSLNFLNPAEPLFAPFVPGAPSDLVPQGIDYNSYRPSLMQYNLTVEHQFPGDLAVSVSYAGSRGIHLWTVNEGNPEIPSAIGTNDSWYTTLSGVTNANGQPAAGSPRVNQNLVNSGWGSDMIMMTTAADSWYNALQVVVSKKLAHGLQFQSAYTWSKVLDTYQGQMNMADCSSSSGMQPQDPFHPFLDKGPSCFDSPNNWRLSLLYHFPSLNSSNHFVSKLTDGWWVGNLVSVQSGYAFSPIVSNNRSQSNAFQAQPDRLDYSTTMVAPGQTGPSGFVNNTNNSYIPYNKNTVHAFRADPSGSGVDWWNPLMFVPQAIYGPGSSALCPYNAAVYCSTAGTAGRDILRGPGYADWDFSLVKDTKLGFLGEGGNLEFRAEMFNFLNHTNWGSPTAALYSGAFGLSACPAVSASCTTATPPTGLNPYSNPAATAGKITSTTGNSRQVQLGLKIIF